GFWHGANWTFIVWGALNAIYFLPLLLAKKNRTYLGSIAQDRVLPSLRESFQMLTTFGLTVFAWIFFRAESIGHSMSIISKIFSSSLFSLPAFEGKRHALETLLLIMLFLIIEWNGREEQYATAQLGLKWRKPVRYAMYYSIFIALFWFGGKEQQFIYFQF
ncbi:MAG: MBOAT family protein, partial [Phycisphaerae bacterium]